MFLPSEIWQFIEQSYADADAGLPNPPRRIALPKDYSLTFNGTGSGIAAGATQSQPLQIQANGDFVLCRIRFTPYQGSSPGGLTASTAIIPLIRIQITDSGTDEQYGNVPIDINAFATNTGIANSAPDRVYPRLISGASTLNIALSNYENADAWGVDLVLQGVLVKTFGN